MKIMIVDDHTGIRRLFRKVLEARGAKWVECAGGTDAVALYGAFRPDWVFMDSTMKDMNGFSATRRLTNRYPLARVLIISDDPIEPLHQAARAAGACGFMAKDSLLHSLSNNPEQSWNQLESAWLSPN